ncbi:unnamed protein product [Blepharisma stoltei]|uniref:Uncharacterized protein n=1 Tax=Blepharisma stoltei TaxID=1481888 RepID=A0AAU9J0Q1_9CILI|nr:unnamed protein product [Blepharisma stoltei]
MEENRSGVWNKKELPWLTAKDCACQEATRLCWLWWCIAILWWWAPKMKSMRFLIAEKIMRANGSSRKIL